MRFPFRFLFRMNKRRSRKRRFRQLKAQLGYAGALREARREFGSLKVTKIDSVAGNRFLRSFQWRKVRMEALVKYGNRCQCCGSTPKDGIRINVDHILPRKTHPELALELSNLQILCEVCNQGKGNTDTTDWR